MKDEINLSEELTAHYLRCKEASDEALRMLREGQASAGTAAVLTATTGALKELKNLQDDLYNIETAQNMEKAFMYALRSADNADELIDAFEEELARLGSDNG